MANLNDYAQLASAVYQKTEGNQLPIPSGWSALPSDSSGISGFSAGVYTNGNEIVIAYAGTNGSQVQDYLLGNVPAAAGLPSLQVLSAIELYLTVRDAHPGIPITFTGHSLGGGLASLMAVYFNKSATVFDPAPFALSAMNQATLGYYQIALALKGLSDSAFSEYTPSPSSLYEARQLNVQSYSIEGEVLSFFGRGRTIVNPSQDHFYHTAGNTSPSNLHSILLLSAVIKSNNFWQILKSSDVILPAIFDSSLYASNAESSNQADFLHVLMQKEWSSSGGTLDRFSADLSKLNGDAGIAQTQLEKALTIVAMEYYYFKPEADATQIFYQNGGGIHFKFSDIGASSYKSLPFLENAVSGILSAAEQSFSGELLLQNSWHIQAGNDALIWNAFVDDSQNDAAIGGVGDDVFDAGSGNDILIGGAGNDTLIGGLGNDVLIGGLGHDTYSTSNGDVIHDADGLGEVRLDNSLLKYAVRKSGEQLYKDNSGNTYSLEGTRLVVNDALIIDNFQNKDLGIYLDQEEEPSDPSSPRPPDYNPRNSFRRTDPLVLDLNGNGKIDTIASVDSSTYFDFNGDSISERSGWIAPDDGLLAIDSNGNGVIDNLSELFGNAVRNGFADLKHRLDSNDDDVIDESDTDFSLLRIWQDSNGDGISQTIELKTLSELGIQSIGLTSNIANITDADNLITATGAFIQNGHEHLIGDVQFAVNFALTDSNPNRPLDLNIELDADIYPLPWLRGYGEVKSLHQAYQDDVLLRQAARDLIDLGKENIFKNFESFFVKWAGLEKAHLQKGVVRTSITMEDKVWILETFTSQNVHKSAIQADGFLSRNFWDATYINEKYHALLDRASSLFAMQAFGRDFIKGAYYSLSADRYLVTDMQLFQTSLEEAVAKASNNGDINFILISLAQFKNDGASFSIAGLKASIPESAYASLLINILDAFESGTMNLGIANISDTIRASNNNNWLEIGSDESDLLIGAGGHDILIGGSGNDVLQGQSGNDTYVFNLGDGQDIISDYGSAGNLDTIRFGVGIAADDITFARNVNNLVLTINGTDDRITIQNWHDENYQRIEQIVFADGVVWNAAYLLTQIPTLSIIGTNDSDTLQAWGGFDDTLEGLGGNDILNGNSGNDILNGGSGNDVLRGQLGNDTYVFNLGDGRDVISDFDYTAGNIDTLQFGVGIAAEDITFSRDVSNLILAINGTDDRITIQGWRDGDYQRIEQIVFADGTVWDNFYIKNRVVMVPGIGTSGRDFLNVWYSSGPGEILEGLEGDDTLSGGKGNDTLVGGGGNDTIWGQEGSDTYLFGRGDGKDVIIDQDAILGNIDTIRFGDGITSSDIIFSRNGSSLLISIAGTSDQISVDNWSGTFNRIEQIVFADGMVWDTTYINAQLIVPSISGTSGNDYLSAWSGFNEVLEGGGGNDTLYGGAGNDTLVGGTGDDNLQGGTGNDTYVFNRGDGRDIIYELGSMATAGNIDTIQFGTGIAADDIVVSREGFDLVISIAGTDDRLSLQSWGISSHYRIEQLVFDDGTVLDVPYLASQAVTFVGTNGADRLEAWSEMESVVEGLGGNDALYGNTGDDTLIGGAGDDILQGRSGNDTYFFNFGDGKDVILDQDSTLGNVDTIQFGEGIDASDIILSRNGYDLVVNIAGTDDRLTVQNWWLSVDANRIERIIFSDGTAWESAQLNTNIIGTNGDDWLSGTAANEQILGNEGNDFLDGRAGNDTLVGGAGNDSLQGGIGNDTYLFNRGDGKDVILDQDSTLANVDTIRFGVGIAADEITFVRSGNDLVLDINGTSDRITISQWNSSTYRIEQIVFADGTVWNAAYLQAQIAVLPIIGTNGNDYLQGDSGNNTLNGGAGNDSLQGQSGNDTYVFNVGDGQDIISDYDSVIGNLDTIRFGEGIEASDITFSRNGDDLVLSINGTTDQITIQYWKNSDANHIEEVVFADGTVWDAAYLQAQISIIPIVGTSGDDYLHGDSGNNTLIGGVGNDNLYGQSGNDTYVFNVGDGQDIISDYDSAIGNLDTIRFGEGIEASDITFSRNGYALVLSINGTTDQITIQYWKNSDANHIEEVVFADGTVWDAAYLQEQVSILPIIGTSSDDYLQGDSGSNTLEGGAGNDYIYGGSGNDTYVFNVGDGQDIISDYDSLIGNLDTIRFGEGIAANDIMFSRGDTGLVLSILGTGDQLTIENWGYDKSYRIEKIVFDDGTIWDSAYLQTQIIAISPIHGTADGDTLTGWAGIDEVLQGLGGDDSLFGSSANELLDGGAGDDYLNGNDGSDIYIFNLGDGRDTISNYREVLETTDTVRFGEGILASDITFSRDGDHLILGINGTNDQITIENWNWGDNYQINSVEFADGTLWDAAYLQMQIAVTPFIGTNEDDVLEGWFGDDQVLQGLGGNDVLYGQDGNDILSGGAGNDTLSGASGEDIYLFDLGGGQDVIRENEDDRTDMIDTIRFGEGILENDISVSWNDHDLVLSVIGTNDQVTIQYWGYHSAYKVERVEFADGTVWDAVRIQEKINTMPILGTNEDDYLQGDSQNNTLNGRAGNDYLEGGSGNDIYIFNRGDGQDTIYDDEDGIPNSLDVIRFGTGIAAEDISFSRDDNALVLSISGTSDQVTIMNWTDGDYAHIERIEFADGAVWDTEYIQSRLAAMPFTGTSGDDYLQGNLGNNILNGGAGNDYLEGKSGSDTYIFNLGDGQDTIYDEEGEDGTPNSLDVIRFGAGIAAEDINFIRVDSSLVLSINGTNDQLTIQEWGYGDYAHIERLEFNDGTVWDAAYLMERVATAPLVGAGDSDDYLQGWNGINETLQGLGGNDELYGEDGNDILSGGVGDDYLNGSEGNDTYIFNLGDGQDTIYEEEDEDGTPNSLDVIRFGMGIATEDIRFSRDDTALVLSINGTSDQVTIMYGAGGDYARIERIEFADGAVWDTEYIQSQLAAMPIMGTSGNDYLQGNLGNNILNGGTGNDYLAGQSGNDIYIFNLGDGQDIIADYEEEDDDGNEDASNIDTIHFGVGINAEDVIFSRDYHHLVLSINGTDDRITIQNWRFDNAYRIEQIVFSDGVVWDAAYLQSRIPVLPIVGTSGDDTLAGWSGINETLQGLGGNDFIFGLDGNDILSGGTGDDYLGGGEGNDIYLFNLGDGQDTISEWDETQNSVDSIHFGEGISASDVDFSCSRNDVILKVNGTSDQLTIEKWGDGDYARIENITFSDGTTWDAVYIKSQVDIQIAAALTVATDGDDELYAWAGMGNGIYGLDGNDSIYGSSDNNILHGGNGDDSIVGSYGNDLLLGGDGVDDLQDEEGINLLDGGNGDDSISVMGAANFIIGGTGADYIYSEEGSNVIAFNIGDGVDTISVGSELTLSLGKNILASDLTFDRDGESLILNIGLNDSIRFDWFLSNYEPSERPLVTLQIIGDDIRTYDFNAVLNAFEEAMEQGASSIGWSLNDVLVSNILTVSNDQVLGGILAYRYAKDGDLSGMSQEAVQAALENANLFMSPQAIQPIDLYNQIIGTESNDQLTGGIGAHIFQANSGDDDLSDSYGNNLFYAGTGNDVIVGGSGNEYFAGGADNDNIETGTGADVIVFNRGDGQDLIVADGEADNTLSLGHGISYDDLSFAQYGNDLILSTGTDEQITFENWYASVNNHSIANLQMIIDGTSDYDSASTSVINNKKIQQFDFDALVAEFDQARIANPTLTNWALSSSLLDFHLSGSDTAAIGGDLAYQYAENGDLSTISVAPAQSILGSAQFGSGSQTLAASVGSLQDASPRLM